MGLLRITIAAIAGTTFMTSFSYVMAKIRKKQFKEPEILNELVSKAGIITISPAKNDITGWLLHYMVGFFFSTVYDRIWKKSAIKPNLFSGITFGAISGIFGIMIWNLTFKVHPNPPKVHLKEFYIQLFFAHLIFGYFAMKGYSVGSPVKIKLAINEYKMTARNIT